MLDGLANLVTVQRMYPVGVHLHVLSIGRTAKRSYLRYSLDCAQKLHVRALTVREQPPFDSAKGDWHALPAIRWRGHALATLRPWVPGTLGRTPH